MNISADTGTIELENETFVLGPDLTHEIFRDSATGRESKLVGYTDVHRSYHLPAVEAHGTTFLLSVSFEGERLTRITWMDGDPSFGSTYAEWSEEKEQRRNDRHHEWLEQWGIALGEHAWGTVAAGFSGRDEESSVAFIYNAESG
jgi:hypothetical protein